MLQSRVLALVVFIVVAQRPVVGEATYDVLASRSLCEAVSPVPSQCSSIRGRVTIDRRNYPNFIQPQFVSSIEECATLCDRRAVNRTLYQVNGGCLEGYSEFCHYCKSFEYIVHTGLCQPWGFDLTDFVDENPNGPSIVAKPKGCYTCPATGCEAPYDVNLLDNSGFEKDLFGPWESVYGTFGPGSHSTKAFQCSKEKGSFSLPSCSLMQAANTCPLGFYRIQFDYKLPDVSTDRQILFDCGEQVRTTGRVLKYIKAGANDTMSQDWKTYSVFCRIPPNRRNSFAGSPWSLEFGQEGQDHLAYQIDNVKMVRVPTQLRLNPSTRNLLSNGGFESGVLTPWRASRRTTIASPGIGSTYAAMAKESMTLVQTVKTTVGKSYLLTATVQIVTNQTLDHEFTVTFGPPGDNTIFYFDPVSKNRTFSIPYSAQHARTRIKIKVLARQGQKIVIDKLKFGEIALS